jgi:hypothetical protein
MQSGDASLVLQTFRRPTGTQRGGGLMSFRETGGVTWLLLFLATVCVAVALGVGYRTLRRPEPADLSPEFGASPDKPLSGRIERLRQSRDGEREF